MKKKKEIKKTSNNKGFTLIEIITVVIIIGIIIVVSGIAVTGYIENSKSKTYESYKADLKGASENYLIDCMTTNEEGCSIPSYGNDLRISYNELESKGYTEKLKDPEGEGYCDKSYVIASNKSESGVNIEYQVCLYCSKYKSEEAGCEEIRSDDVVAPTCGETKGESNEWSKENKVITVKCSDEGEGCTKSEYSSSIGKEGEVIKEGSITIEDKAGNKTTCEVEAYVDRKAPTCKIELDVTSSNGWYKTGVTARVVNMEDEGSGVESYGIGTSLVNRKYNGNTSYTVTGGIVTVFGYVKDKVGNEGYCSKEIKVDNTEPSGSIYMGYEVYPKENSTRSGNVITVSNISKYGEIEGVIVYFNESVTKSIGSDVLDESGKTIKTSGGITSGKDNGIIRVAEGSYEEIQINIGDSSYVNKVEKIEVIKREEETSVWTNKEVSVYVEGKDTITGVKEYSYDGGSTYISSNIKRYSSNTEGKVIIKDQVGNESEEYEFKINKIDKEEPECELSATGTEGENGWYTSNVTIGFSVYEDKGISGVKRYGIGDYVSKTATLTTDTSEKTYTGYIEDNAGNTNTCTITVKRDTTKPTCGTITINGTEGENGWYTSDVTITKTDGSDATSENVTSTLSTTAITNDTEGTIVTLTTTDEAGNTCTTSKTVKIDKTKPTCGVITLNGTLGNNGWYISDVTATKTDGSDTTSGHYSTTLNKTSVTSDTTGTTVTLTTTDNAGNTCTTSKTVKRDATEPTCGTIKLSGTEGNNGWYTSDVTITKSNGSDTTSGHYLTTLSTTSITSDTTGTTVTLITTDKAGNACATSKTVKVDTTNPTCGTIKLSGTEGNNGWYTSAVTITKSNGSDTTSGHYSTTLNKTSITSDTTGTTVKLTTTDKAGNTCTTSQTVKVDTTNPYFSYDFDNMTVWQNNSAGETVSEVYLKQGLTCTSSGGCSGAVICIKNVTGKFDVSDWNVYFKDDVSGYDSYEKTRYMYREDGSFTENKIGCLRNNGDSPCDWEWTYTIYDKAGNSATGKVNMTIEYIGDGVCK